LSGCKALAGGLVAFKTDLENYPCPQTRELLIKRGLTNLPAGDDANAYLAQLLVTDIIDDEGAFHCESGPGYHRGDNIKDNAQSSLAPGENSYAYVMAQGDLPLTEVHSMTPLVIAPILSGGDNPTFDPLLFGDKFVYGAVDGSGKVGEIDENGRAKSKGRDSLFQPGEDSLFGKQIPDVKIPTRKY